MPWPAFRWVFPRPTPLNKPSPCEPGTLALTLARQQGLGNIDTVHRAWGDDWVDVPVCDIAIASRSTTVEYLDAASTTYSAIRACAWR